MAIHSQSDRNVNRDTVKAVLRLREGNQRTRPDRDPHPNRHPAPNFSDRQQPPSRPARFPTKAAAGGLASGPRASILTTTYAPPAALPQGGGNSILVCGCAVARIVLITRLSSNRSFSGISAREGACRGSAKTRQRPTRSRFQERTTAVNRRRSRMRCPAGGRRGIALLRSEGLLVRRREEPSHESREGERPLGAREGV
jgi:hypothetical protein